MNDINAIVSKRLDDILGVHHNDEWTTKDGTVLGRKGAIKSAYKGEEEYKWLPRSKFSKLYEMFNIEDVADTKEEEACFARIHRRMSKTNMALDNKGLPITSKGQFAIIFGGSEVNARKIVNSFIKKGLLACGEKRIKNQNGEWIKMKRFYINPLYVTKGDTITIDVYLEFKELIDQCVNELSKKELKMMAYAKFEPEEFLKLTEETSQKITNPEIDNRKKELIASMEANLSMVRVIIKDKNITLDIDAADVTEEIAEKFMDAVMDVIRTQDVAAFKKATKGIVTIKDTLAFFAGLDQE